MFNIDTIPEWSGSKGATLSVPAARKEEAPETLGLRGFGPSTTDFAAQ
jgi:hypothetical protein